MAKQYKIKRYHKKDGGNTYKAGPHPLLVLLTIVIAGGLIFVGISIYEPVSNFILGLGTPQERPVPPIEEVSAPEEEDPGQSQAEEPDPGPAVVVSHDTLLARELPLDTARNSAALTAYLDALPDTVNAVMVRLKGTDGLVRYQSALPSVAAYEAQDANAISLDALTRQLQSRNLGLVVYMTAFQDPVGARGDRENNPIFHRSGVLWLDNAVDAGGKPWLNPYAPSARSYLTSLVEEVTSLGAALVILDDVRFPNDATNSADYKDTTGLSRHAVLQQFLEEATLAAESNGARVAPYLPQQTTGSTASALESWNNFGGSGSTLTSGSLVIRVNPGELRLGGNTPEALNALLAPDMQALPQTERDRLIAWMSGVPTAGEAEVLTALGINEYVLVD